MIIQLATQRERWNWVFIHAFHASGPSDPFTPPSCSSPLSSHLFFSHLYFFSFSCCFFVQMCSFRLFHLHSSIKESSTSEMVHAGSVQMPKKRYSTANSHPLICVVCPILFLPVCFMGVRKKEDERSYVVPAVFLTYHLHVHVSLFPLTM